VTKFHENVHFKEIDAPDPREGKQGDPRQARRLIQRLFLCLSSQKCSEVRRNLNSQEKNSRLRYSA